MPPLTVASHALTLSTRNISALQANFLGRGNRAVRRIEDAVKRRAVELFDDVYIDCPRDTHYMVDNLRLEISEMNRAFEVGWYEPDFTGAGKPFYPVYVIFGTRFMPANNVLFAHRDRAYALLRGDVREIMREAAR